jgi:hypothetical protein
MEGDTAALRLCLERIAPLRRDARVTVSLPELKCSGDALTAINHIVQAVARGDVTPGEASKLAGLIEAFQKTAECEDLEHRVRVLEEAMDAEEEEG